MEQKGNLFRKTLYRFLSTENYLRVISKLYLISFDLGLLKNDKFYEFPYFLKNIIKKNDVCIDIGANLGYLTVLFSKLVGANGKVYAVEPVPLIQSVLRRNVSSLHNVEIYPYALGADNKKVQLSNHSVPHLGFIASGSHAVIEDNNKPYDFDMVFDAEMRRGSELFSRLTRLDFIKVDIEGYEVVVLPEMEPIIKKFNPILLVEARGQNRIDMLQFFESIDYRGFELNDGVLTPAQVGEYWDILFVPTSKLDSIKQYVNV